MTVLAANIEHARPRILTKPKILVVDDRRENLFAMERILRALPVEIITADSGNDALRQILRHQFAVAILDVQMPDMDGFETAELMRANESTQHLPIIFVSAISKEQRYVFQGYESGAVDYLFKPIDANILLAKLRIFIELEQNRQQLLIAHEELKTEIRERQRMEQELTLAQKLEAVGQLAAGIAHEINTPIQYIGDNARFLRTAFNDLHDLLAAHTDLLVAVKTGTVSPEQIQAVEEAVAEADAEFLAKQVPRAVDETLEGVNRVAKIVLAMKDFSHPGSEEKGPVDINHALESTITVARNEWKYAAEMVLELDPTIPSVQGFGGELNQVFLNMLVNAAHTVRDVVGERGEPKGKIRVATRRNGSSVEVHISDTGTGIPAEIRQKIFDPFFTTKEVGRGTGQGLSIARSVIVEKHGGQIDVQSVCGQGTTFVIRLPID